MAQPLIDFTPALRIIVPLALLAIIAGAAKHLLASPRKRKRRGNASSRPSPDAALAAYAREQSAAARDVPAEDFRPTTWSVAALQRLEWKRFEAVCVQFLHALDFDASETQVGADGGTDIILRRPGRQTVAAIAQCKAWNTRPVGVKPVRELYGVMAADQVEHGIFLTTSSYTDAARDFAKGKNLDLVTGERLVDFILQLKPQVQSALLAAASAGDYSTPTCPNCDVKMVKRVSRRGSNAGTSFWGCVNYPRCHHKLSIPRDFILAPFRSDPWIS